MKRKIICSILIVILLFQLVLPVISATGVLAVEIDNKEELLIDTINTKLETNLETIKFGSYSSENKEIEEDSDEIVKESTTVLESTENISEAYLEWSELSEEEKQNTVEPRKEYVDISELQTNEQYVTSAVTIPESYNLREVLSNIKTEHQGFTGNCYAYAGLNSVETNIAIKTGTMHDFSEMHVEYMTSSLLGGNRTLNAGGNFQTVVEYSKDLQGPVLESEIENKDYTEQEYNLLKNAKPVVTVTETIEFPTINKRYGHTEEELSEFREAVKMHIMENGSVYASMYFSESSKYYNSTTKGYACLDTTLLTNHAVSIIGWDDNYLAENFPEANRPVNNGAWIALNSHGNSFGDKGVFYISYEDNWIEYNMSGVVSTIDFVDTYGPKVELSNYTNENNTISATINVYDIGGSEINTSNLKYQWTQFSEEPSLESFTNTFSNGDTLTKSYADGEQWYLWILAYDVNSNYTISGAVKELVFTDKNFYNALCYVLSENIVTAKENDNRTYSIFMTQDEIENVSHLSLRPSFDYPLPNSHVSDHINNIEGIENFINLKYLSLFGNNISSIDNIKFPSSLEYLGIGFNKLTTINDVVLPTGLKVLDLHQNEDLTQINVEIPNSVEELNLHELKKFEDWETIEFHDGLKILNLTSCNLGQELLEKLNLPQTLNTLTLGDNGITNIDCLENLINLTNLCIGANSVSDISVLENFNNLEKFNASDVYTVGILDGELSTGFFGRTFNQISNINNIDFADTIWYLDLGYNQITDASNVDWPNSLEYLMVDNNLIENVSIDIGINLDYVDFSNNKIKDLSKMLVSSKSLAGLGRCIVISNNEVESIPAENWKNSRIDELVLSNNNISSIDNVIWPEHLDSLAIDGNNISSLNNVTWKEDLRYLILNNNNISEINNVVWPEGIRAIEITNNNIEDLSWIEDLTNLTAVALNQNNIYNIESLSKLSKLQEIHLDQNYIEDISPLENLSSLSNLKVRQQNIIKTVSNTESITVPQIIQKTMETNSNVYTESDITLTNCEIQNNSIIFETDNLGYIYAIVTGGNADGTILYITNNTEDKIIKDVNDIKNKNDLIKVKDIINYGHYDLEESIIQLNNNIDLGGLYNEETDSWSGDTWEPIGNEQYPFAGIFEGNGYKITGLYINTDKDYQGLIGYSYGTIQNLTVEGYIYTTGRKAAGICGASYPRDTEKVATIRNCINEVDICSTNQWVGGICAIIGAGEDETSIIENSCNNGDIQGSNLVGGICGHNSTGTYGNSIIRNCYNTGIISGGYEVGGICGLNQSDTWDRETGPTIKNCYNIGFIRGDYNLGGIVGTAEGKYSTVKNCYNVGLIQKSSQSGNIIGSYEDGYGIVENCYYYDRSGLKAMDEWGVNCDSFDNELNNVYGITEEYLKSTEFTTLLNVADRECTWVNVEDYDYPVFDWQDSVPQDETILKEIKLGKAPTKKKYTVNYADGEELDLTGGKIVLIYTYKDEELEVEKSMTDEEITVSAFDNSILGEQTISVTYKEKTTSFTITVEDCTHEYGEWVIENQPTENEEGLKYRICTKCNFREEKAIIEEGVDEIWDISATEDDDVIAKLYDDGTLKISGTGKMTSSRPWEKYIEDIIAVEILEGVTNIGYQAFWKCTNLESVIISNTVTDIEAYVFAGCSALKDLIIPSSVKNINTTVFRGCSNLENIFVDGDNQNYLSENGILFNKEKTTIVKYPEAKLDTVYEIPKGITQIADSAFWESENLMNIEIPDTVTRIQDTAFYGCINIQSLTIPKSVTYIYRSSLTFSGVNSIKAYCGSYAEEYATKYYSDKLSVIHDYEETTRVEATCLEEGNIIYTCVGCSDTYNEEISATGHTEVIDKKVDATCTESGLTEGKHCSRCNEVLIAQQVIDALGHEEVIDNAVEAACTKDGLTEGKHCSRCDEVLVAQQVIDALGHEEVIDNAVEAACTKDGLTEGKHCSRCDEVLVAQEVVNALGHDYQIKSKDEAVCEQGGMIIYECTNCGDTYEEKIEPTGHTVVVDEAIEPTCTDTGLTEGSYCLRCKEVLVEQQVINALGHEYESTVTTPTCTEQGYTTYTCKVCTHSYVENYVDAKGHTVVTDKAEDATCTETGLTEGSHCSVCDAVIVAQQVINALGHDYDSVVTEPTCTEKGYTTYTCKVCTHSYVDNYIDAKGHTVITDNAISPTCTETGLTEGRHCSICDTVLVEQEVVKELGHTVVTDDTVEATCTETGLTEGSHCSVCDTVLVAQVEVPKKEHSYGNWVTIVDATCEENGKEEKNCANCVAKEERTINKLGHNYAEEWTVDLAPTCTEEGSKSHHCTRCDSRDSVTEIEANGHTYGEWTTTSEASCEAVGSKERTCSVCTNVETEEITALGHEYNSVITNPTCTEGGFTTHTCTRCSNNYIDEETEALGHNYETVTTNSSCTEVGYTTYKCTKCQHEYVDDNTDSLGHDYIVKERIEATCINSGNIVYECSRCNDSYNETIQAKGHIEVIDETVSATCTEKGLTAGKHCSVCEEVLVAQEEVVALGHNFGAWVIDKEATYEEDGHKYRVCTNCNTEKEEQVIPKLAKQELEVTTTYTVKEQDGQKFAVMSSAKEVEEILSNITSNKDLEIVDKSGNVIENTTKVGTGAKVVEKQTKEVAYIIVVKGDANGDAKIDFINDIIRFNNYRLNLIKLDTASMLAGDINDNGKMDFINDIISINNYRLGITNSL